MSWRALILLLLLFKYAAVWQERPQIIARSDSRSCNNAQEHQAKSMQGELLPTVLLFLQTACAILQLVCGTYRPVCNPVALSQHHCGIA